MAGGLTLADLVRAWMQKGTCCRCCQRQATYSAGVRNGTLIHEHRQREALDFNSQVDRAALMPFMPEELERPLTPRRTRESRALATGSAPPFVTSPRPEAPQLSSPRQQATSSPAIPILLAALVCLSVVAYVAACGWFLGFPGHFPLQACLGMGYGPDLVPSAAPGFTGAQAGVCARPAEGPPFEPSGRSLSEHAQPAWLREAKLGIFVHWGLYSVPAYAPTSGSHMRGHYAEWYLHSMLKPGNPTAALHEKRYHEKPSMDSYLKLFVPEFNKASKAWNATEWAEAFKAAGAKYVMLTTKHHDSFCLWPTTLSNPNRETQYQHAERDIVGELTSAVRSAGMEMGLYYSGGYDWSFQMDGTPTDPRFEQLAFAHVRELLARYKPALLWDDMGWPGCFLPFGGQKKARLYKMFAEYFNVYCPEGAINDRWMIRGSYTGDFGTPEYEVTRYVSEKPFELCRGIGSSFGYNAEEEKSPETSYMTPGEAAWLLADTTARNGRLLLDVGPTAAGSIPKGQLQVLRALGEWMEVNSEAINGAEPYLKPGTDVNTEGQVRYTRNGQVVYAVLQVSNWMTPVRRAELLATGVRGEVLTAVGPKPLQLTDGHWSLPVEEAQQGSGMPLVLRFRVGAAAAPRL